MTDLDLELAVALAAAAEDVTAADRLRPRLRVRPQRVIETAHVRAGDLSAAEAVPENRDAADTELEQARGR